MQSFVVLSAWCIQSRSKLAHSFWYLRNHCWSPTPWLLNRRHISYGRRNGPAYNHWGHKWVDWYCRWAWLGCSEYSLQLLLKSLAKLDSNRRCNIEPLSTIQGDVTKNKVHAIANSHWTEHMSTLQLQIVKTIRTTFKGALPLSYFSSSNNCFKTSMVSVDEQALSKMEPCGRVPTIWKGQICDLVQIRLVANRIVQNVLSNTGLLIQIAETVIKLVYKAVDEWHLLYIKIVPKKATGTDLSMKGCNPVW